MPLAADEVPGVVRNFGALPIYGWEFIDVGEDDFARWSNRLSFDVVWVASAASHSIDLFQDSGNRIFGMRIWFDDIAIQDAEGQAVEIDSFIADGVRWWDALYAGRPAHPRPRHRSWRQNVGTVCPLSTRECGTGIP